jgi:FG-GAP repeat/CARDB
MRRKTFFLTMLVAAAVTGIPLFQTSLCAQSARADFNGDGREDLAIGVPNEAIGNNNAAGAVHVLYGSTSGTTATGSQLWSQDGTAVKDIPDTNDHFGAALAAGDFDGDGFADLAIGVPGEDEGLDTDCGAVNVLYGSADGLRGFNDQFWAQGTRGVKGFREDLDAFGSALASGDFNGDGFDDLAIGVPLEDSFVYDVLPNKRFVNGGCVNVVFGTSRGLDSVALIGDELNDQVLQNNLAFISPNENFGQSLVAGDFNRDGRDDLAIGIPGDIVVSGVSNTGSVNIYMGTEEGFLPVSLPLPSQRLNGPGVFNIRFGTALAAGDFNGDLFIDLAIGSPFETVGSTTQAGVVKVFRGSLSLLQPLVSPITISQQMASVPNVSQSGDEFGAALAAGDYNGDGFQDLAVGVPGENIGALNNCGTANILFGKATGLDGAGSTEIHEDSFATVGVTTFSIADVAEANDQFGRTLFAGDFNNDGRDEMAVGVPGEASGSGAVHVFRGGGLGISVLNSNQYWTQGSTGIAGGVEAGDAFGGGLPYSPRLGPGGPGFSGVWQSASFDLRRRADRFDSRVRGELVVFNPGGEPAADSVVEIWLSNDDQLSSNDTLVHRERRFKALKPGESRVLKFSTIVEGQNAYGKRLIGSLDATNVVAEANETNNIVVSGYLHHQLWYLLQGAWQLLSSRFGWL